MASIGVFDSGSGGLSVLREIRKILPDERYIYFSDNAYCPYGEKTAEFVTARSRAITDLLLSKGCRAVVVACNTATAAAIAELRLSYDIPFVGMEPAVKPAASGTRSGVVGVLATAGTLKASKYQNTKEQYADAVHIEERVGQGFVELVENLDLESPHAECIVRASLQPLLDAGADTIVLGCTHYPFLLPLMRRITSPDIHFIDPAPAVARRLADVLKMSGIPLTDNNPGVELLSSGPDDTLKKLFKLI
ncbi:MAG: glutamate racemase [Bacteroidales bacterium]|nr:glutamate racemase [Bacteroidales bacterium]